MPTARQRIKSTPPTISSVQGLESWKNSIDLLLSSDNVALDDIQEVVDYIIQNKNTLDTLGITSIAGLQNALDLKANSNQLLTPVPASAKFTDTTYTVGDGGLSQINFTSTLKNKLDAISANAQVNPTAAQIIALIDVELGNSDWQTPGGGASGYSYFYIWAEENADLGSNAFEWAFGNGANTPASQGVIIGLDCELVFLGLSIRGSASCTVDVLKNGALQDTTVSTASALRGQADVSLAYAKGDYFNFKTLVGNAASNGGIVTAMFRVAI